MLAGHQAFSLIRLAPVSPAFWAFHLKMSFSQVQGPMHFGQQLVEFLPCDPVFHHEFWSAVLNQWLF
jgi:hypothetical protein